MIISLYLLQLRLSNQSVKNINDAKFIRDMSNFDINEFNNDLTERLYHSISLTKCQLIKFLINLLINF